jgi:uncharacterized protein (DUF433 family)
VQIEDYFEFESPDEIRIKGHRIWIEHVLYQYIYRAQTAEEIAQYFDTLTLEQVYAVLLYYLKNKEAMNKYMADWMDYCRTSRQEARKRDPAFYEKMRRLKEEMRSAKRVGA